MGFNAFDQKVNFKYHLLYYFKFFFIFFFQKGAEGSWGEKANRDLIHTRGKSFRHEKTKKKRGSYRGGKIDSANTYSIKYDSSD